MYAEFGTVAGTEIPAGTSDQRYRLIVDRIEELARSKMGEPVHIPDLCADAGIGERMLRNAFHAIHHCPPYRRLRAFRMAEARKALLTPEQTSTVTQIAMRFGFFELGRFSVEYRQAFGERPSETLRRAVGV